MMIQCYETEYRNFGRCVCLENGIIKLMAMLDAGPRIIYFGTQGHGNILFEDLSRDFYEMNKGFGTWYAYGGHRLWSAPEQLPDTYYPDNSRVSMKYANGVLTLEPPQTPAGMQHRLIITMTQGNAVHIRNEITNMSEKTARFAPWSVTGLASGGTEFIPLCTENNGFLPNRTMSLWSYSGIQDPRFCLTDSYATLRHDKAAEKPFKVGFNVTDGYIVYVAGDQVFKKTFASYAKTDYPDFCCNFETYTNRHFLECELLGEERDYRPSETAAIDETWEITDTVLPAEQVIASCIAGK